jgi:hypothetical protein
MHDPAFTTSFHKYATIAWVLLVIPTLIWWRESVLWVALMSIWANVASHWAAYQASRAEQHAAR